MTQYYLTREDELYHWGIKGQKWGQRRWQNEDGSLTPAGREHYGYGSKEYYKSAKKEYLSADKEARRAERKASSLSSRYPISSKTSMVRRNIVEGARTDAAKKRLMSDLSKKKMDMAEQEYKNSDEYKARQEKIKKAAIVGAAIVGTALVAYGAYKYSQAQKDKKYTAAIEYGKKYYRSLSNKFENKEHAAGRTVEKYMNSFHKAYDAGKDAMANKYYNDASKADARQKFYGHASAAALNRSLDYKFKDKKYKS